MCLFNYLDKIIKNIIILSSCTFLNVFLNFNLNMVFDTKLSNNFLTVHKDFVTMNVQGQALLFSSYNGHTVCTVQYIMHIMNLLNINKHNLIYQTYQTYQITICIKQLKVINCFWLV